MSVPADKLLLPFNPYTHDSNRGVSETQKGKAEVELNATHIKLQHDLLKLFDEVSSKLNRTTNTESTPRDRPELTREHVAAIQTKPASRESATRAFVADMEAQLIPAAVDRSADPIADATRKAEQLLVQLLCTPQLPSKL